MFLRNIPVLITDVPLISWAVLYLVYIVNRSMFLFCCSYFENVICVMIDAKIVVVANSSHPLILINWYLWTRCDNYDIICCHSYHTKPIN